LLERSSESIEICAGDAHDAAVAGGKVAVEEPSFPVAATTTAPLDQA